MRSILLTLTCLLAFAVSAFSTMPAQGLSTCDATEERVVNLPQDQGAWYLTVFGEAEDAKLQEIQSWLKSDVGLTSLKSQTHFNEYTTDQTRYQRYAKNVPGLPCIRLQNEKGLVVSEFYGDNIPTDSGTLLQGIKYDMQNMKSMGCLRRRQCPTPPVEPPVEPPAPPVVEPDPPVGPPVLDPEPEPEESKLWLLLVALGAVVGAALGVAQEYQAEHMDKTVTKL